jgi:conjugal transfer/type IV secretion protein DotA/TraY
MGKGIIAVLKLTPNKSMIKRALRFAFMPEFGRGLKATPAAGAARHQTSQRSFLTSMLVQVFVTIGLLEKTHPWANPANRVQLVPLFSYILGKLDWKHAYRPAPMIAISTALLLVMGLFVMTSFAGNMAIGAGQAYAADSSLFSAPSEDTDLALKYIGRSFGVPVGSSSSSGTVDAVVEGFQRVMGIYSTAMLILGGFILFYIISTAVMATAHEGRFGGSSFNQVWAPIRLVVAVGLLVPLPMSGFNGYNSGQYIVIKIAELGSGLASNLWIPFVTALMNRNSLIAPPSVGYIAESVRGVYINEFCKAYRRGIADNAGLDDMDFPPVTIARREEGGGSIAYYYDITSSVDGAYCGVTNYQKPTLAGTIPALISEGFEEAYKTMREEVATSAGELVNIAYFMPGEELPTGGREELTKQKVATDFLRIAMNYQTNLATILTDQLNEAELQVRAQMLDEIEQVGWAGASIWFNTVSRLNSEVLAASRMLPISAEPTLKSVASKGNDMDEAGKEINKVLTLLKQYISQKTINNVAGDTNLNSGAYSDSEISASSVTAGLSSSNNQTEMSRTSAYFGAILARYFVPSEIFGNISNAAEARISEVHPLASLSKVGDMLIDKSLTLILVGTAANVLFENAVIAFLIFGFAGMGIGAGILLAYVTPLMPFIRSLFAIASWLMNILEAIIAIPLVALAHLTTKGEGVSGDMARTSYFLVFSIFIRPPLLIVGLIVAMMMFTVAIGILNDMFKYAVTGLNGNGAGGTGGGLGTFIYILMYAVIAYSLCNMCFKLIEEVPDQAMRWIGQSAAPNVTHDERVQDILSGQGDKFIGVFSKSGQNVKAISLKGGGK